MCLFRFCSMICPLLRVGCWNLPLLFCVVQCVFWALSKFLLWMWVPLHFEHRCSELRVLLGRFFFLWWVWSVLPCLFWWFLVESQFYPILEWLLWLVSWDHLLGKLFSSLLLWDSVCLWTWGVFPVCSKILSPVYLSSLLVYVFLLGNWVHWC